MKRNWRQPKTNQDNLPAKSAIAHYANENDLTLRDAALKLGYVTQSEFDRIVDPRKMVKPYVATAK